MPIGLSDGSYYDDEFAYASRNFVNPSTAPEKPAGKSSDDPATPLPAPYIDRTHDVPLAASALMKPDGSMYGIAIDKDIPPHPEYDQFVYQHEAAELPHMQNLMAAGMSEKDAYHEAHDKIATPTETAAVRAHAARNGLDPDQYLDQYKQFWRDGAAVAGQGPDFDRHPDAHTTQYHLDEHEGVVPVETPLDIAAKNIIPYAKQQISKGIDAVKSAVTLPGDAAAGNVTPDQEITRSADLAKMMVGFPGPKPAGAIGSFAGILSEKADIGKLNEAIQSSIKGTDPKSIWENTGWFRDVDNEWKYEIGDAGASLSENVLRGTSPGGEPGYVDLSSTSPGTKLSSILDHPKLFEAYPMLKDVKVQSTSPFEAYQGIRGWFNKASNTIGLSPGTETSVLSTLLHEVQHKIQDHEGFATGGNTSMFEIPEAKEIEPLFRNKEQEYEPKLKELGITSGKYGVYGALDYEETGAQRVIDKLEKETPGKGQQRYDEFYANNYHLNTLKNLKKDPVLYKNFKNLNKVRKLLQEAQDKSYEGYTNLAGEAESRNVQGRMKFVRANPSYSEQSLLRANHPHSTLDVPVDKLDVRGAQWQK